MICFAQNYRLVVIWGDKYCKKTLRSSTFHTLCNSIYNFSKWKSIFSIQTNTSNLEKRLDVVPGHLPLLFLVKSQCQKRVCELDHFLLPCHWLVQRSSCGFYHDISCTAYRMRMNNRADILRAQYKFDRIPNICGIFDTLLAYGVQSIRHFENPGDIFYTFFENLLAQDIARFQFLCTKSNAPK